MNPRELLINRLRDIIISEMELETVADVAQAMRTLTREVSRLPETHHIWGCRDNGFTYWSTKEDPEQCQPAMYSLNPR